MPKLRAGEKTSAVLGGHNKGLRTTLRALCTRAFLGVEVVLASFSGNDFTFPGHAEPLSV